MESVAAFLRIRWQQSPEYAPYKKNVTEAADFVKQYPRRLGPLTTLGRQTPAQPVWVFYEAESQLGLHLSLPRRLTGYGVKPVQIVEPLYEYYLLYAVVDPTPGDAFWGELLHLDADCFTVFLRQFGQHYADSLNTLLLDQAPAHIAQRVEVPENVILVWLPAYSPELNLVERLWEELTTPHRRHGYPRPIKSSSPSRSTSRVLSTATPPTLLHPREKLFITCDFTIRTRGCSAKWRRST